MSDLLQMLENNPEFLILFTVFISILIFEALIYIRSMKYILFGIFLSGIFFMFLIYIFYGMSPSSLDPVLYFIVITAILLLLTFILTFFIFSLLLVDLLLILHVFFRMDLNSLYTWLAGVIITIILYFILRFAGRKLERSVFAVDKELRGEI